MQVPLGLETPIRYCERWEGAVDTLLRRLPTPTSERAARLLARCRVVEETETTITVRADNELDVALLERGGRRALERLAGCSIVVTT